jgi:hypothetical protein
MTGILTAMPGWRRVLIAPVPTQIPCNQGILQEKPPKARRRGVLRTDEHYGLVCGAGWNSQAVSDDH